MSHGWNNCDTCGEHYHDAEGEVYGECPRCTKGVVSSVPQQIKSRPDFEKLYYEMVNVIGHLNHEVYNLSVERTELLTKIQDLESNK